jgi:tetratricopeptide (TPR) repeat protein
MSGPFGNLDRLIQHLDARLESHPNFADVRNLRALARLQTGDVGGARADLEAALGVNPDYAVARFGLAWLLLGSKEPSAAARATDVARPLPAAWRRQLEIVRVAGTRDVDAALAELDAGGAQGCPWFELDRLWLLAGAGRWAQADQQLLAIAAGDGDLPSLLHATGLFARGAPDHARVSAWAAAYRGNPHFATLCSAGAELAHAAGDIEQSRRLLAWGVALSLDLCGYWTELGVQHESLGEGRAALVALRRAVQVDPERLKPRTALGYLFAARGQAGEAIAELEVGARLAPQYADVRYQLGLLYAEVGRAGDAEAEFRAALEVHSGYVLARLALACLLETQGRDAEALELLQTVRRAGLRSADIESRLAAVHARLGHRNQARRAQARARATNRSVGSTRDPQDIDRG